MDKLLLSLSLCTDGVFLDPQRLVIPASLLEGTKEPEKERGRESVSDSSLEEKSSVTSTNTLYSAFLTLHLQSRAIRVSVANTVPLIYTLATAHSAALTLACSGSFSRSHSSIQPAQCLPILRVACVANQSHSAKSTASASLETSLPAFIYSSVEVLHRLGLRHLVTRDLNVIVGSSAPSTGPFDVRLDLNPPEPSYAFELLGCHRATLTLERIIEYRVSEGFHVELLYPPSTANEQQQLPFLRMSMRWDDQLFLQCVALPLSTEYGSNDNTGAVTATWLFFSFVYAPFCVLSSLARCTCVAQSPLPTCAFVQPQSCECQPALCLVKCAISNWRLCDTMAHHLSRVCTTGA
jgi:hypothetical protein